MTSSIRVELDQTRYIMATIRVPIEINTSGEQTVHNELYQIEYSIIDDLPDIPENRRHANVSTLFSKISETFEEEEDFAFREQTDEYSDEYSDDESESQHFPTSLPSVVSPANFEISYNNTVENSGLIFKPEYTRDSSSVEKNVGIKTESGTKIAIKESIEGKTQEPDTMFVKKNEIREKRPFPKSKTFRRAQKPPSRFSRKSETRFLDIPLSILAQLTQK